ncbi:MAG: pyrroloquinoline quinone-dependent dehydrogenase [Saprospiraceae bacterium]|nr:pyrroloquinoline quinone-dependent dehydrogenase [Saprospiraceae bacterium]
MLIRQSQLKISGPLVVWTTYYLYLFPAIFLMVHVCSCQLAKEEMYHTWSYYNGDQSGSKYSALDQITRDNVRDLKVRWKFKTGDLPESKFSNMECNPLVIGHTIYVTSPTVAVIALNANDGKEIWRFETHPGLRNRGTNRGLAFWSQNDTTRLFFGKGNYLYCLDASDGKLISSFGVAGRVNLKEGLNRDADNRAKCTTPGVIYGDLYILGATVGEGPGPAAPGYIRAFDVRTGAVVWTFHTIPLPGEPGYETWPPDAWKKSGGANAWGGITLDVARGMVFCGTGSAAYDHWGGDRIGQNLYANCVLALDANMGRKIWHYQVVHHDIWDYDIPCAPNLVQVKRGDDLIDAVAQPTKMGHLFVLDRETGEPVFPVEELPVPKSEIPGEVSWPTQPFPPESLRYARQEITTADITDLSTEAREFVKRSIAGMETGTIFRPPSKDSALIMPQFNGGTDWGGAAYDPLMRKIYVNASNEAEWISMAPAPKAEKLSRFDLGSKIYQTQCTFCHGNSNSEIKTHSLTSLQLITKQRSASEIMHTLANGKGNMPKFNWLSADERLALVAFLKEEGQEETLDLSKIELNFSNEVPWLSTGHHPIKDNHGFPINKRPWGTLSCIDLDAGGIEWQVPLGTYPTLEAEGFEPTGTFNLGGPLVTAGGLVFIAATMDERFRAFDKETGEMLWEFQLDAGGYATPATFEIDGEQFVMIAAGGGGIPGTPSGDSYYCFSL